MKKIILAIVLLLFCFVVNGQMLKAPTSSKDTATWETKLSMGTTAFSSADAVQLGDARFFFDTAPKFDTVKVIMLVCDTTDNNYLAIIVNMNDTSFAGRQSKISYWQYGYLVKQQFNTMATMNYLLHDDAPIPFHYEYLDENKKPLSKSIVVWLSKEIK